jgi:hypothetical protein
MKFCLGLQGQQKKEKRDALEVQGGLSNLPAIWG